MSIVLAIGTRPCVIKQSPLMKALKKRGVPFKVLHADQHFDDGMDGVFLRQFGYENVIRLKTRHAGVAAQMKDTHDLSGEHLEGAKLLVVYGDTMSAALLAIKAKELGIKVAHVEAGCRSFDVRMPEENYRCLIDSICDYRFCPTDIQLGHLNSEGHDTGNWVVGNTIQDVVWDEVDRLRLTRHEGNYALVTVHRPENVDDAMSLDRVVLSLRQVKSTGLVDRIIWPVHPRMKARVEEFPEEHLQGFELMPPMSGEDFLQAEAGARVVITDSGGVQEETYILGVPCVTIRRNTERPETLSRCNVLCDLSKGISLTTAVKFALSRGDASGLKKPYGDWRVGEKIVDELVKLTGGV